MSQPTHTCIFTLLRDVRDASYQLGVEPIAADDPRARTIGYMVGERRSFIGLIALKESLNNPPKGWTPEQVDRVREAMKTAKGRHLVVQPSLP